MAKNITPNQEEWKKELKRLNQFIKRAEKRGYIFGENIIPETPKKITKKKLSEIKQIDADVLYNTAKYFDKETGQIITGLEGRRIERRKSSQKAAQKAAQTKKFKAQNTLPEKPVLPKESDIVLRNIEEMIANWQPLLNWSNYFIEAKKQDKTTLSNILQQAISETGREEIAKRLQNAATNIIDTVERILYSSDEEQVNLDLVDIATIIKGRSLTPEESIDLTESSEYFEEQEIL